MENFPATDGRSLPSISLKADFVVVGGGLAGLCAALRAAREGVSVILLQDRPVLGGNASSEVRLWALGATSHMGNNNRWAREGGIMGEIMEENLYRNKEGNPVFFDLLLLDMANSEPNLTLLLNTSVFEVEKRDRHIEAVRAFNSINETFYSVEGTFFCDASGDGVVGCLSGAGFRVGAEERGELGERMAPGPNFGQLLGHSIYFTTRRSDRPVDFVPPSFALQDFTKKIPRYRRLTSRSSGAGDLWWMEWGGELDTVHDSEKIKWELWKIIWGAWDHIKNSGEFDDAADLTVDWVGLVPGKRESRRFLGDTMLCQKDIIEQIDHPDAVTYGGWAIDLHPARGVYSPLDACVQYHSKGTYTIPWRCYYSRDLDNLFLAGRVISVSHVAFGSSRVMATCALGGEAVGEAATLCLERHCLPRAIAASPLIDGLRSSLMFGGFYIPRHRLPFPAGEASVSASSCFALRELPPSGRWFALNEPMALMLPLKKDERLPKMTFPLRSERRATGKVVLLLSEKPFNHTPERRVAERTFEVAGETPCTFDFDYRADCDRYVFVVFEAGSGAELALTDAALPGVMTVFNGLNPRVAKKNRQTNDGDHGVDEFDFWLPRRRPDQILPAVRLDADLACYDPGYVLNGKMRPEEHANAWMPAPDDPAPWIRLDWKEPRTIREVVVIFDGDFDNAMESVYMGHPDAIVPHCVVHYRLTPEGCPAVEVSDNRHSVRSHKFAEPCTTKSLKLEIFETGGALPAVYAIHVR